MGSDISNLKPIEKSERIASLDIMRGVVLCGILLMNINGMALAEPHVWNKSLWVHEFHVAASQRGRGVGRRLMDALVQEASCAGLRTIVCETQNTNAPAIHFYQRLGFRIEGVDLSYYSNDDHPDGEIALFMKRPIA